MDIPLYVLDLSYLSADHMISSQSETHYLKINCYIYFSCTELSNAFSSFFGGSEEEPQAETVDTPTETTPIPEDKMDDSNTTDGDDSTPTGETTPTGDQEEQPKESEQEEVQQEVYCI